MLGFLKKNDNVLVLNQKLGRLLNDYCYAEVGDEMQRTESRMRLGLPCLLFLLDEADDPRCYASAVTSDISLHGVSLVVPEALDLVDYIFVIGPKERHIYIKSTCKRCEAGVFGTFTCGFQFHKVLSPNDYPAIVKAIAGIEAPIDKPTLT